MLSVYRLPLSMRYLFTVIRGQWLMPALRNLLTSEVLTKEVGEGGANGKCIENRKWTMVNVSEGGLR